MMRSPSFDRQAAVPLCNSASGGRLRAEAASHEWYERLKDRVFTRLAELGVAELSAYCEGGGDMGEVVSVETTMEPGRIAPILEETGLDGKPMLDAINDVVTASLSGDYPGWEIDGGSNAWYRLEVAKREIKCEGFEEFEEEADDDGHEDGDDGDDEE